MANNMEMEKEHTVKAFDEELAENRKLVGRMIELVREQLDNAMTCLVEGNDVLAKKTMKRDSEVNNLQDTIDTHTLRLLAMRQPVAVDLRHITSAGKMAADLERIADYTSNIAMHSLRVTPREFGKSLAILSTMGTVAGEMLESIAQAYAQKDVVLAGETWHRDDEIDSGYSQVVQALSERMQEEPSCMIPCLSLLNTARALERIGDHTTNLAEQIHFMITGEVFAP